jgi:predicted dehydrogenase
MGRAHAKSITAYGAQVAAVHDVHVDAAQKMAAEVGAEVATDDCACLFDRALNGVVIATPPPVRLEPVRTACERGVHLMVEKPPALTLAEGRACLEHIEKSGVIAAVGFQLRYAPLYERLKELLVEQTIHLVRTVCAIDYYLNFNVSLWFLQSDVSGGPIAEQAIHLLDCVRFIMDNPKPVQAHALAVKNMAHDRPEFDAENAVQVTYELSNGVFGTHANHCGTERFSFDLEVIGPRLRLQANVTSNRITGYLNGQNCDEPAPVQNSLELDKTGAWLRAIETGDRLLIRSDFADSLRTLALVEAAVRSRGTGRFVRVEEL